MSNQLKNETSPYLLQHAQNPVNWYPWCEEAFDKARSEDKPVFLSIGYSTCHWCHVMAHESFEDHKTAQLLNQHFISIKVDREERPDIDSVYMSVCQSFTGNGGWPMSIFMTGDKKPFFAGTYFPSRSRYGMPSFCDILNKILNAWNHNRSSLLQSAEQVISQLKETESDFIDTDGESLIETALQIFSDSFDPIYGGFGFAPKFPTPHNLLFLMFFAKQNHSSKAWKMAETTLIQMRKGGIFDQIGYGFSRYSTDRYFLVPHFEKMLYDNALLIIAYSAAYQISKKELFLTAAQKTAAYILGEMTSPYGGFYSAEDADSNGVEGKFYTFTYQEILDVLGKERGKAFAAVFDITEGGNFEGVNILNLLKENNITSDFDKELELLYTYRKNRAALHLDDKILLSWNSMMIAALAILFRVSGKKEYLQAAKDAYLFIEQNLCDDLQLYTSYRNQKHSNHGFLDDYAFYITALMELYHSTLENSYLIRAKQLCKETVKRFMDFKNNGFFLCEANHTELFMNPKETYDGAIPSGNSVMAYNLVRLYQITEEKEYEELAKKQISFLSALAQDYPAGHSMFLLAKLMYENPPKHIVMVLKTNSELSKRKDKLPFLANLSVISETKEYPLLNGQTTYYVCHHHSCLPPTNEINFD